MSKADRGRWRRAALDHRTNGASCFAKPDRHALAHGIHVYPPSHPFPACGAGLG